MRSEKGFLRPAVALAAFALVVGLIFGSQLVSAAPPKISLEQCRNGSAASPNDCELLGGSSGWQNGNAGASNAHFVEGHSIPYRAIATDVPSGSNTVLLGYDIKHSGVHAIDFLTHYDRLEPHGQFGHSAEDVDPTDGYGPFSDTATCDIPKPGNLSTGAGATFDSIAGADKDVFTVFGATSCSVSQAAADGGTEGDIGAAQSEARVQVTFNATSSTVVLAWGGHIARTADWPPAGGAAGISGSPYHMRLKAWSAGNVGNQDRSLSAAAVLVEQSATATQLQETDAAGTTIVQSQVGTTPLVVSAGAYVRDIATVTPSNATGSVAFRYYPGADATAAIAACNADTTPPSAGTLVAGGPFTVTDGTATSAVVQFTTPGFFAWRAFFDGTGIFEDSASSCSNEVLQVQIVTTSLSTTPKVLPNDSATVSATAGGNVAGSVKFRLYDSSANCNADPPSDVVGTGGLLYKETVSLPGDATSSTVSTSNTTVEVSANATVYWLVEFTSTNAAHQGRESVCVENVALTGDAGPGTAP